jgi:hypothetical protein
MKSGMSRDRWINVQGGFKDDDGNFTVKKEVELYESRLRSLMRTDWEMCAFPIIKIRTVG